MKSSLRILFIGVLLLSTLFFTSGCENTQIGVGVSGYNSSTGMSYGMRVSDGPYGRHGSTSIGYSSGGYYGRPY